MAIQDAPQRIEALQPHRSFIVQAPAGSGKTALLVYRILVLLARVDKMENVLAITFTRKATAEMKQRLIELLEMAQANVKGKDDFEQYGITLAKAVLQQDAKQQWELLLNPNQLQILTIDAFSQKLCAQMPWLSRLGGKSQLVTDANQYYIAAVDEVFKELLNPDSPLKSSLILLLQELDFNYAQARLLITQMLAKRDQWMRYFVQYDFAQLQSDMERVWQQIVAEHLRQLQSCVSKNNMQQLMQIITQARESVVLEDEQGAYLSIFDTVLRQQENSIEFWLAFKQLVLSQKGEYRRTLTKREGFLAKDKDNKARMQGFIHECETQAALLPLLVELSSLPEQPFSDGDWQQLMALKQILEYCSGILMLQFDSQNTCDHTEVAIRANWALSQLSAPTDLALKLDYQIQHILVDEFQDTSHSQLQLLKNLTAAWQVEKNIENDKSLFLVGDPMQSIYRFREADVGLFVRIANNATTRVFDNIHMEFLQLSENFRSNAHLVSWFNQVFDSAFPKQDEVFKGAVKYAQASSSKQAGDSDTQPVQVEWFNAAQGNSEEQEAESVVRQCQDFLDKQDEKHKCSILVRSRNHLPRILLALEQANIPYAGVDIFPLSQLPAIEDIITLTKAICRPIDRLAWFALLRGPWLGLTLSEMGEFAHNGQTIWQQIHAYSTCQQIGLSEQSDARVRRFHANMQEILAQVQQVPLTMLVKWAWQILGGESTLFGASLQDVEACFEVVQQHEKGGVIASFHELEKAISALFAGCKQVEDCRVFVSTMHKAKGLQYHTVILPSLARKAPNPDKQVMMWSELSDEQGQGQLVMAPYRLNQTYATHYDYLRSIEKKRDHNEAMRLLYVACTRAEEQLVLMAGLRQDEQTQEIGKPISGSLLSYIWASVEPILSKTHVDNGQELESETEAALPQSLFRLPDEHRLTLPASIVWQNPSPLQLKPPRVQTVEPQETLEYAWASELARAVGIVMHDILYVYQSNIAQMTVTASMLEVWKKSLRRQQCPPDAIQIGVQRLKMGIEGIQKDSAAAFIFQDYAEQHNEYELTHYIDGEIRRSRIDRTFVDDKGARWIVDYKATYTQNQDVKTFAREQVEQRHKEQLERYAEQFSQMENRTICLAVYFPMLSQLVTWEYTT